MLSVVGMSIPARVISSCDGRWTSLDFECDVSCNACMATNKNVPPENTSKRPEKYSISVDVTLDENKPSMR